MEVEKNRSGDGNSATPCAHTNAAREQSFRKEPKARPGS